MRKLYLVLVFIVNFTLTFTDEDDHEHNHAHHGGSREEIVEELSHFLEAETKSSSNETLFFKKDVEKALTSLSFRNCSENEASTTCNLCLSSDDIYKALGFNTSQGLEEEDFLKITEYILYFLIHKPTASTLCKNFISTSINATSSTAYNLFVNKYNYSNGKINGEESVEKILHDVEESIGPSLNKTECFGAHDVISKANVSETTIDEEGFHYVSGFIVLKLLNKSCIADDHKHAPSSSLPNSTEFINSIFTEFGNGTHMTHENFEKLSTKLKLENSTATTTTDSHAGHNHRKRRSVTDYLSHSRQRRSAGELKTCFGGENILSIFNVPEGTLISKSKFQEICPALVQQIESDACVVAKTSTSQKEESDNWKPWIGMLISVLIISIFSMVGVFVIPIIDKNWFPFIIMFLIALAVGTLLGDSILHLIPHSFNLHKHEEGGDHAHEDVLGSDSYIWKSVLFLVGVFVFFTFEITMHAFGTGHSHSHNSHNGNDSQNGHVHHLSGQGSLRQDKSQKALQVMENGHADSKQRKESLVRHTPSGMLEFKPIDEKYNETTQQYKYAEAESPDKFISSSSSYISIKNFKSLVWMILVGDALHNFVDGIAIGVAFSEDWPDGLHGGISTSIAILCHELPHELGDFAVLLASGLSIRQALLLNFLSSLSAFLGGIVGVAIGISWDSSPWIFAITAGLFVYIALADMFPEALHSESLTRKPLLSILLLDLGLLVGFVILFVLAAYEEDIKTALK